MKIIVTADIEVHTKTGDVSTTEIRQVFNPNDKIEEIISWIDKNTDELIYWINQSLGILEITDDNNITGTYALKKNVTIKPVEE